MGSKRKLCFITGTRAEYGLLSPLMKRIRSQKNFELQLIVTGMHLSPEFGLTHEQIEKDGFEISFRVEMLLSSDTDTGISKSIGLGVIGFAEAYFQLRPDILVVLGDRFELFSAVTAAINFKIPIVHIHGGELTEGAIDEAIRHSITKMSHLHFTATDEYRRRVIQLGENPERVYNVGALGIDNIHNTDLIPRNQLEKSLNSRFGEKNLLITFHPVTLEEETSQYQFGCLLQALDDLEDTHLFFTKANSDNNGRIINEMIDRYVAENSHKATAYLSLGTLKYLSLMKCVDGVIGNSSSGLIEAPSFNIGTVNVGDRQRGRVKADSVIDCRAETNDIRSALQQLFSKAFQQRIKNTKNPYGNGGASDTIIRIIENFSLDTALKKKFHDLDR